MIDIRDFTHLTKPGLQSGFVDSTPVVREALQALGSLGISEQRSLVLPKGTYHFWPDRAIERYLFVSNNDESLKRIAFPLFDLNHATVDGQGSKFIFHGPVVPFAVGNSQDITLKNFSIDFARSFHSEAHVIDSDREGVTLEIPEQFPYRVEHGRLNFLGERGELMDIANMLEFDINRRETAFMVWDNYGIGERYNAQDLGSRRVRFNASFKSPRPTPGNILAIASKDRLYPAVIIFNSQQVRLNDVNIYHAGGMGVIAQHSRDLELQRVQVTPPPDGKRMISLTADATHFVNCSGHILLEDCLFENQLDDPTNVHGIYGRITQRISANQIEVQLVHYQQLGIDIAQPGDRLELVHGDTLLTYHQALVSAVKRINREYTIYTLAEPLPGEVAVNDAVANIDANADLTIRNCVTRGNRARGFLVSTGGKVLIEDNHFHNPGAAILIAGDANHWFESGAVRDVTIRKNRFDNCNFGVWGRAAVQIQPEIPATEKVSTCSYHRNISIEDNEFIAFDRRLVFAQGVEGLVIRNNRIITSTDYPQQHLSEGPFEYEGCTAVTIEANQFVPAQTGAKVQIFRQNLSKTVAVAQES
jgi:hypothetical protein